MKFRKIVCVNIPRIFMEGERLRQKWDDASACVIAAGLSPSCAVIDFTENLRGKNLRRGMPLREIRNLTGEASVFPVDFDYMREINWMVIDFLKGYSIVVESGYFGGFYIDLTGTERLFGRVIDTCGEIVSRLRGDYGFSARIGVAGNKLSSCLAARVIPPGSVYEIPGESEEAFLSPLDIFLLPEVPREVKREILSAYNIRTLGELRAFSRSDLSALFGGSGGLLYDYSRNISPDRLVQREREKVIKQELELSGAANDDPVIRARLFQLVLDMCARMRGENVIPLRFNLRVVYRDDYVFEKGRGLKKPSFLERRVYAEILPHLDRALERRTCLKKVVLKFFDFIPAVDQASLFPDDDRELRLSRAFDSIRERFGKRAIFFP